MPKKYIVKLTDLERELCHSTIDRLSGSSQKVRRAYILLKTDCAGPGWTDAKIAEAYRCRETTVKNIRQRFVDHGFEYTLNGKTRVKPPRDFCLDGAQEAKIIATRLGDPPAGYSNWSLRLLAERVVALGITDKVSHETCRKLLKKTA